MPVVSLRTSVILSSFRSNMTYRCMHVFLRSIPNLSRARGGRRRGLMHGERLRKGRRERWAFTGPVDVDKTSVGGSSSDERHA